ncbi:hypothetical protein [Streptomyces sp. NPDC018000]|uniref:hypothetical protein n=1 Tax=Streptomyces sp. NPDC018000 TaxID=3365028 RepID=UPI00379F5A19
MELYLWNVRLSAAFGEVIALAEVILRNAMAEQLAARQAPTTRRPRTRLGSRVTLSDGTPGALCGPGFLLSLVGGNALECV